MLKNVVLGLLALCGVLVTAMVLLDAPIRITIPSSHMPGQQQQQYKQHTHDSDVFLLRHSSSSTSHPSTAQTISRAETFSPSNAPTFSPSSAPTLSPNTAPTFSPSTAPTLSPSTAPTFSPSTAPTFSPSNAPTLLPSNASSTASPSNAPTTTSVFINEHGGEIWQYPTPERDVASTFNDFRWEYPRGYANASEYARKRFTENELKTCTNAQLPCCAIGGTGGGGGSVTNGCGLNMDFMAEFKPIPARPLFSLVDFLIAWRERHMNHTRFTLTFIGDSVTGQIYMGALCELARNVQVSTITHGGRDSTLPKKYWQTSLSFKEAHIQLRAFPGFDFCLLYIRQYRLSLNDRAVEAYFADTDVIVFGWGLHYTVQDLQFPTVIQRSLTAIRDAMRNGSSGGGAQRILFWMGAPAQHFRYDGPNAVYERGVTGAYFPGKSNTQYCGALARLRPGDAKFNFTTNHVAFDEVLRFPNATASWIRWNEPVTTSDLLHVHFFPFAEITAPFYRNHVNYNPNSSIRANDCTHSCNAPNLFEPVWDALYLIAASDDSAGTRHQVFYPAGTQQFPNITFWNGTRRYEEIEQRLQGETT